MKKLVKNLKSQKGFTLIEMIIVISIMGVLIALLLPNLMGFFKSSSEKACEANVKMLQSAVTAYLTASPSNTLTDGEIDQAKLSPDYISEAATCPLKEGKKKYVYTNATGKVTRVNAP